MRDPLLQLIIAASLAWLFVHAARHKLLAGPARFGAQLEAYRLLPRPLLRPAAVGLPVAEGAVAAALLFPATREAAGVAAALLLLTYGLAMLAALLRGQDRIDCGCGGVAQPVSLWLVVRNVLLAGVALQLLRGVESRPLAVADAVALVLLTGMLALIYGTMEQLMRNEAALGHRENTHG